MDVRVIYIEEFSYIMSHAQSPFYYLIALFDYYATSGPPIQSIESLDFHLESAYTHLESSKMSHARFSMAYS